MSGFWVTLAYAVVFVSVAFLAASAMAAITKHYRDSSRKVDGPFENPYEPREHYRIFDMNRMKHWGYAAHWLGREPAAVVVIYSPQTPRLGDVVLSGVSAYVITKVNTPRDPGDQHFADVVLWGDRDDLPPSKPDPNDHGYIT